MRLVRLNPTPIMFDEEEKIMSYAIKHKLVQNIQNLNVLHIYRHHVWKNIKNKVQEINIDKNIKCYVLNILK